MNNNRYEEDTLFDSLQTFTFNTLDQGAKYDEEEVLRILPVHSHTHPVATLYSPNISVTEQ